MIILDTNVVSELMRITPSPRVSAWFERRSRSQLAITAITEAEILYGLELLPRGKRRDGLLQAARSMFNEDFRGASLVFDSEAAQAFAIIAATRRSGGKPISHADAQIAAITRVQGAELATRNVDDFNGCGIQVVNPWHSGLGS